MRTWEDNGHLSTEELFRQHAGFVARLLTRLGVLSAQLEDAVQEVFLVVLRNGGYQPGLAKPTSYLRRIAMYVAAKHRRQHGADCKRRSDAAVEQVPSDLYDPARALQVRRDLQRMRRALERLPKDLYTTLLLVDVEGESCVSVAAGLGCPVGTVYWRLHLARAKLQAALRIRQARTQSTASAGANPQAIGCPARVSTPPQPTKLRECCGPSLSRHSGAAIW